MKKRNSARRIGVLSGSKMLMLLASLLMVLSLFSSVGGRAYAEPSMSGSGSIDDPWQVKDQYNLAAIGSPAYPSSDYFILVNDIELTGEWTPIGLGDSDGFSGTLDGNGHKISGLSINRPSEDNIGLFSKISKGNVYNLTIETDATTGVVGKDNVGILAGAIEQTGYDKQSWFNLIKVGGNVTGENNVGGLAGKATASKPSINIFAYDRMASGTVTGTHYVGGLVGYLSQGQVYNSHSEAAVEAGEGMGGLLGYATDLRMARSYATGDVTTATGDDIGGLIGVSVENEIQTSYAVGDVAGSNGVGGLIGYSAGDEIAHSYAAGQVSATDSSHGGLIGDNDSSSDSDVFASYWDTTASGVADADESDAAQYGIGRDTAQMQDETTFTSATYEDERWDFDHVWFMEPGHYPQLFGGMDVKFDVDPSAVSDLQTHAHDLTIEIGSIWIAPSQAVTVYHVTGSGDEEVGTISFGASATVPFTLDTTGKDDGMLPLDGYYLLDQDGNRTSVFYPEVTVDNTPPVWEDGVAINQSESGGNVTLTWGDASDDPGSGVAYYNLYVNGTATQVYDTTYTMPVPSMPAIYEVEAVDAAGNKSIRLKSSAVTVGGVKNIVIGQPVGGLFIANVTGAPSFMQGIDSYVYGGTLDFYLDDVLKSEDVEVKSPISMIPPNGIFTLIDSNLSEGIHTVKAVYSGYQGDFHGTDYAVGSSEATFTFAASSLNVTASDPSGAENDGKTQLAVTPDAASGDKLVYRNFGSGSVTVPNVDDVLDLTVYADLPADGLIAAANGDNIGVVEIETATGKVVHFGQAAAVAVDESTDPGPGPGPDPDPIPATGLTVTASDPSGAGNDGKTLLAVTPDAASGDKLVYRNFGSGSVTVPNVDDVLDLTVYADLPADGLIAATNGDNIGVAEIETATGKVVHFGQAAAVAVDESTDPGPGPGPDPDPIPATGLTVTASDPSGAGNDGKTLLAVTPDAASGDKLVYRNFGSGSVTVPNVDDVLDLTVYADLPADGLIAATNGDNIGVAEIETATGKVVHFGQTAAVAVDESTDPGPGPGPDPDPDPIPATGLTVTPSDPSGAENDGKTQLAVTPDAASGDKLVYRNFGSGSVTVPNVDDVLDLTVYADLPADGLIAATNGDNIGVAEIETATGKVVHFGQTAAVAANEPVVTPPVSVPTPPVPTDTNSTEVLVNGKVENLGTTKTSEADGVKTTTVTLDPAKLQAKLDAEGSQAIVTIPLHAEADRNVGELNGQIVKNMESASATLVLQTNNATYSLPAQQINVDAISGQLGQSVALEDIIIQVEVSSPNSSTAAVVENAAAKGEYTLVAPPVEFTVRGIYGDRTIEVARFNAYVERMIAIPDGVDPSKITTGVVVDPDGTTRHVPTKIVEVDGRYYAKINSLTNSTYAVVWHPLEFADMAEHWAKDAVNDMGARMIIEGTSDGLFSPDRDITRAEFAAVVVRALGLKLESGAPAFSDVQASDWFGSAIGTAREYGLIDGLDDGTFRPNDMITREQAMVILSKAMAITGLQDKLSNPAADTALLPFADASDISAWAHHGVAESIQAGIASGRNAAELAPKDNLTRAEAATLIQRLLQQSGLI